MLYRLIIIIILFLSYSCQNTEAKKAEIPTEKKSVGNSTTDEIQTKVDKINSISDELTVVNSLSYQHNDGSTEEVFAYLDKNQKILKIEEKFKVGTSGNSGIRFFYFENGKRIMSQERFIDAEKAKGQFRERISYYNASEQPILSKERLTTYEEDLEKLEFTPIQNFNCSMERAENVLNQKGLFATTFQGFATDGPVDYLIVGGKGESGFASALAVQFVDSSIKKLKANEVTMIDTPLTIEFEKMVDERKLEFQVLTGLRIVGN